METFKHSLEAVHLIPIFTYLNILSDFLYMEKFLSENDQNKQIPIVNALYEYLEHHENNKFKQDELIRNLLKGSDLYGEKEDENFDATFVNAMLDYIITSLVFDKYGNIYGFLANIFCKAENLQLDEVLNLIIKDLKNAFFENEYGANSELSFLSVNRIYNDIIIPLFPRSNANLNLLSLDYIYAQAGSMFLRAGRINGTNYIHLENNFLSASEEFEEFLATGHVIEKLIATNEENFDMLKCFALPALLYYVFNSKYLFVYEDMAHVITDTNFWQEAYRQLFQYTAKAFNDTKVQLQNDYTLKMHTALFGFQSRTALAKKIMEHHCTDLDEKQKTLGLPFYLKYPKTFECKVGESLPDVNKYLRDQIDKIMETYEMYDFQLIKEAFPEAVIKKLEHSQVVVTLLIPDLPIKHNSSELEPSSYDVLEFHFPNFLTFEYYILKRKDYNVSLIDPVEKLQLFQQQNRMHFEKLFSAAMSIVLKTTEENVTEFFQNLVKYKSSRLKTSLEFLVSQENNGQQSINSDAQESLKSDWWKEFGLSLVPYYLCLSDTSGKNCALDEIKFLYKYPDESSKLINRNTNISLSRVGTSIRSVFLKNASYEAVDKIVPKDLKHYLSLTKVLSKITIFKDIAQHVKDPGFPLNFTTAEGVNLFEKIISSLKEKTNFKFTSVLSSLLKLSILKSNFYRNVGTVGESKVRLIFVNTLDNKSDTGYGYKFILLSDDISKIAQFRTGYELKDEMLLVPILYSGKNEKSCIALNMNTFEPEVNIVYEIDKQIRRKATKVSFAGIPIQADDFNESCNDNEYFEKWKLFNLCRRRQRLTEKSNYEEDAVKFVKKNTSLSEAEIHKMLKKYTFPDNANITQFVTYWLKNDSLESTWSSNYIIKNPHLLSKLRYDFSFEYHDITESDGTFRLRFLYSKAERREIEKDESIETIIQNYNEQKATFSVTFHDYYAIRNFATTGYRRITRDTREAKLMKDALYKLAIRQSDDPDKVFNSKLFRVESRPISFFEKTSFSQYITLKKFTTAFSSVEAATRFSGSPASGFMNIMYEMEFSGPYARAKIEQFYEKKEERVILLPGSKFLISSTSRMNIVGLGNVLIFTVKFQHTFDEKYLWHKNIMNQISRIQF